MLPDCHDTCSLTGAGNPAWPRFRLPIGRVEACWFAIVLVGACWSGAKLLNGQTSQPNGENPAALLGTEDPSASELMAALLRPRDQDEPQGRFVSLEYTLRISTDWRRTVVAYWRLVEAYASLHIQGDERALLKWASSIPDATNDADYLAAAVARAEADWRSAELRLLKAQQTLADLVADPNGEMLLPENAPHLGGFRTRYEENFPSGGPPRAGRIHRLLPVEARSLELRAVAMNAAGRKLEAATAAFDEKRLTVPDVVSLQQAYSRQQRAFLSDAIRYNLDIADYVYELYGSHLAAGRAVSMLLISTDKGDGGSETGAANRTASGGSAALEQVSRARPDWDAGIVSPLVTSDLADLAGPLMSQRLVDRLHEARFVAAVPPAKSLTLTECLSCVGSERRLDAVRAYWKVAELAALMGEWNRRLEAMVATDTGDAADGSTAHAAAEAERMATWREQEDAQAELARVMGCDPSTAWFDPVTRPHGGRYATRLADLPSELADRVDVRRRAEAVLKSHGVVVELATAFLAAHGQPFSNEEGRALTAEAASNLVEDGEIDAASELLRAVTNYNVAIAEYALAVYPATSTPQELTPLLVLVRSPKLSDQPEDSVRE